MPYVHIYCCALPTIIESICMTPVTNFHVNNCPTPKLGAFKVYIFNHRLLCRDNYTKRLHELRLHTWYCARALVHPPRIHFCRSFLTASLLLTPSNKNVRLRDSIYLKRIISIETSELRTYRNVFRATKVNRKIRSNILLGKCRTK